MDSDEAGVRIGTIASMVAAMFVMGIPYERVRKVVAYAYGMSVRDFTEWNSKDVRRKDCIIIRNALKNAREG